MIKIDKDILIPKKQHRAKYPYRELEIGDSFFIPNTKSTAVQPMISYYAKTLNRKYVSRGWDEDGIIGVRIWRTL